MSHAVTQNTLSGTYSLSLRVTAEALWGPLILDESDTPKIEADRPLLGSAATPGATERLIEEQVRTR